MRVMEVVIAGQMEDGKSLEDFAKLIEKRR